MKLQINNVRISLLQDVELLAQTAKKLGVDVSCLKDLTIIRKATDARKKEEIFLNYHVQCEADLPAKTFARLQNKKDVFIVKEQSKVAPLFGKEKLSGEVVIIGAGPAGLYAALELARFGYRPLLLERGKKISERAKDVEKFWQTGEFNPVSNCQFGEGGAGTFSDGKLTTRVNDPVIHQVLEDFVLAGGPENILYEHKPHVGTDKLRAMVAGLAQKVIDYGGKILYSSQAVDFEIAEGKIKKIILQNGERITAGAVVLACGHSARDTYAILQKHQIAMEGKNFAIGLRIEHPQDLIDKAQYGKFAGYRLLGAADYMLTYNDYEKKRSCYTFCMCPGGQVVAAASETGGVVVNGMSNFLRDSGIANSAVVVNVTTADFGNNPLDGIEFQRKYERLAFEIGGKNYAAPSQNVQSFLTDATPNLQGLIKPTYRPKVTAAKLKECLPNFVYETLQAGIKNFDRRLHGFADGGAMLTGVETRTSAPLRILRNKENYISTSHNNLYPCGEGAGYAGGIMSAALDGFHVARAIMARYKNN